MTSEAPERIIVAKYHPFKEPDDFYVCHPRLQHPAGVEYVRADLHQQAIEEAEARGYARAIEDADRNVGFLWDQDDDGVWMTAIGEATEVIRALAQKEGE